MDIHTSNASSLSFSNISVALDGTTYLLQASTGNIYKNNSFLDPNNGSFGWQDLENEAAVAVSVISSISKVYAIVDGNVSTATLSDDGALSVDWSSLPAVPLSAMRISAGLTPDGDVMVWVITVDRKLWYLPWNASSWVHGDCSGDEIDMTDDGVILRLDNGALFSRTGDEPWSEVSSPVKFETFASGAAGNLWAIDLTGKFYHFDGSNGWVSYDTLNLPAARISVGDDSTVWILMSGQIQELQLDTMELRLIPYPKGNANCISVANSRFCLLIDSATGHIQRYLATADVWTLVTEGSYSAIAGISDNQFWAVQNGQANRYTFAEGDWSESVAPGITPLGLAVNCDCPDTGEVVLGWDANGNVSQFINQRWEAIFQSPAGVQSVSISAGKYFAVLDKQGTINVRRPFFSEGWNALPLGPMHLIDIAAVDEGAIYATTNDGYLWIYLAAWISLGNVNLSSIRSAGTHVWGLKSDGTPVDLSGISITEGSVTNSIRHKEQLGWDTESPYDETRSTHLWIVQRAADLAGLQGDFGQQVKALINPTEQTSFSQKVRLGLYDADFKEEYMGPSLLGRPTYQAHFYDPDTGKNWMNNVGPTALTKGVDYFYQSLVSYASHNLGDAGYKLGLALHYLTDLTQPMHAANFTALSDPFKYHPAFEVYVMEIQSTYASPATYTESTFGTDPSKFLIDTAKNSKQYFRNICPKNLIYVGFMTPGTKKLVRDNIGPILYDAVQKTSQFLVAWMQATKGAPALTFAQRQPHDFKLQGSPAVAYFQGLLYCFFQLNGTNSICYVTSGDGVSWSEINFVPKAQTNIGVSLAVFKNSLVLAYRGAAGGLWTKAYSDIGWDVDVQVFAGWLLAGPALAVINDTLFCYFVPGDLNFGSYVSNNGAGWSGPYGMGMVQSGDGLAVCQFLGQLYCLHVDGNGRGDLVVNKSLDGMSWTSDATISAYSMSHVPALAVFGGKLYCFFENFGADRTLWYRFTSDGIEWTDKFLVDTGAGTFGAPAVIAFASSLLCLNRAGATSDLRCTAGTLTVILPQSFADVCSIDEG